MPQAITDATFENEVIKSPLPVLVDFWAPWCGPCRVMLPVLEQLERDYQGKLKVVKINIDENQQVAGALNVMSIPTLVLFKDGQPKKGFLGARPGAEIKRELDTVLADQPAAV